MNGGTAADKEAELVQRDNERPDLAREGFDHLQVAAARDDRRGALDARRVRRAARRPARRRDGRVDGRISGACGRQRDRPGVVRRAEPDEHDERQLAGPADQDLLIDARRPTRHRRPARRVPSLRHGASAASTTACARHIVRAVGALATGEAAAEGIVEAHGVFLDLSEDALSCSTCHAQVSVSISS